MNKFILILASLLTLSITPISAADAKGLFTAEERPQMWCLAQNIYYEARGSNRADRMAVADVVINRVQHTYYPNTICKVVHQGQQYADGQMIRHKCQFSWFCDGKSDKPKNTKVYNEISELVNYISDYDIIDITDGATHYHADYVRPSWAKTKTKTIEIEDHIFYRWEK